MLHGRDLERARIAALLDEAWASRGGALALRGQPGAGKSALLADAVSHADGMLVLRTRGIESESPLPFAALQRLLRPAMRHAAQLPTPQRKALRAAFGEDEDEGGTGDRFLVFLATLSLLAEAAEESPVLGVIDDAHWLDEASAAALLFVARRLGPERVALLFAARDDDTRRFEAGELVELSIGGLDPAAAAQLLSDQAGVPVSPQVRDWLMTHTGGNPLALVELPSALSSAQIGGHAPLPIELPLTAGVQRVFLERCRRLSAGARTLLLVAAADDSTSTAVIRQAAARLGSAAEALDEAEGSGLLAATGSTIEFRHPLVRSAIYQGATTVAREQAHRALAAVLTAPDQADRRVWHLAAAADEPDETVASELAGAAERARRRGGYEAASAALERAAELTPDDESRARRLLGAAENAWLAGQLARARPLLIAARARTTDPLVYADVERLRGRIEFNVGIVAEGIRIWTQAARDVVAADPQRAREIAMIAMAGSTFMPEGDRTDLQLAEILSPTEPDASARTRCIDALLTGFHYLLTGELAPSVSALRDALAIGRDLTETDLLTNLGIAAFHLGDDAGFRRSFSRQLAQSRDSGAIGLVLFALPRLALAELSAGRWDAATADASEALQLARSTGQPGLTAMPLAELALHAALRGDDAHDGLLVELDKVLGSTPIGILGALVGDARRWAEGSRAALGGQLTSALHHLGQLDQPAMQRLAAFDRLEVAVRAGQRSTAIAWLGELESFAAIVATPRARAVAAYGRALLAEPTTAEAAFREALHQISDAGRPLERARTELAYGEFLRRSRRRVDAREYLRSALATFEDLGAVPWAERARQELRASGETARKRDASTTGTLTAQELQVARFVADGLSNRDVAAKLFLSPRTIDFHLRNVFTKTGISSRSELGRLQLQ